MKEPIGRLHHDAKHCPHCYKSLVGPEILKENRHCYLPMKKDAATGRYVDGDDDGRPLFYSNIIGMSSMLFDRMLAYKCPYCDEIDVIPGMEEKWEKENEFSRTPQPKVIEI